MGNRGSIHDLSVDLQSEQIEEVNGSMDHEKSPSIDECSLRDHKESADETENESSDLLDEAVTIHKPEHKPLNEIESTNKVLNRVDGNYGQCTFNLIMTSTHANERTERVFSIPGYPTTGQALKDQIQSKFSIPACVQNLSFSSLPIRDSTCLKSIYLQHGDTVHVNYSMNADVEYFTVLISILQRINHVLDDVIPELISGAPITSAMHQRLQTDCGAFTSDCVPLRYFSVFPTGTPNANQLYFLSLDGLDLLVTIYKLLHQLPWHQLPLELQDLEYACLQIIWNFSATLGVRQLIVDNGVMEMVFKTMNRAKIVPYEHLKLSKPLSDKFLPLHRSISTLAEVVYAAIVVTGNFAEMPQCRIPIASSVEVIDTLLAAMLSQTYTYTCARSGMCAMLCLSFSPSTHQYISQEETLTRVLGIYYRTFTKSDGTSDNVRSINQTLVGFYSLLFFSNLLHHWTTRQDLPDALQSQLTEFMSQYVESTTYEEILKRMQEKRYYWSTFIPFLSLCYCPALHDPTINHPIPKHMLELTVKAGILSMKCMVESENALEVIEYEGLKDFISCISWNTFENEEMKHILLEVTQVAYQHLRFQPPSLCNIVKAMLASCYCGLDKVLECDTYSLVTHMIANEVTSDVIHDTH